MIDEQDALNHYPTRMFAKIYNRHRSIRAEVQRVVMQCLEDHNWDTDRDFYIDLERQLDRWYDALVREHVPVCVVVSYPDFSMISEALARENFANFLPEVAYVT